jgi:hypothetical protein
VKISVPHPLLDPYRYFGYLFEKNAYPDVLDTCSKKEYVSDCSGYLFENEYVMMLCVGYIWRTSNKLRAWTGFQCSQAAYTGESGTFEARYHRSGALTEVIGWDGGKAIMMRNNSFDDTARSENYNMRASYIQNFKVTNTLRSYTSG